MFIQNLLQPFLGKEIDCRRDLIPTGIKFMFRLLISLIIELAIFFISIIGIKLIPEFKSVLLHKIIDCAIDGICDFIIIEILIFLFFRNLNFFRDSLPIHFFRNIITFLHILQNLIPARDCIAAVSVWIIILRTVRNGTDIGDFRQG